MEYSRSDTGSVACNCAQYVCFTLLSLIIALTSILYKSMELNMAAPTAPASPRLRKKLLGSLLTSAKKRRELNVSISRTTSVTLQKSFLQCFGPYRYGILANKHFLISCGCCCLHISTCGMLDRFIARVCQKSSFFLEYFTSQFYGRSMEHL